MIDELIYAFISSFLIGVIMFRFGIQFFLSKNIKQVIRVEGPKTHHKKAGTPTMGGLFIIITTLLTWVLVYFVFEFDMKVVLLLLFPFVTFGSIGFLDDYLISFRNSNTGLSGRIRLLIEVVLSAIYFLIYLHLDFETSITLFGIYDIELTWIYGMLILAILVSSANAVNLTDGIDGLAGGLIVIVLIAFIVIAYKKEEYDVIIFNIILIGAVLSFLLFNFHPAKIFMGDTGSLALGSTVGSISVVLGSELLLIIIGFVFVLETLSVIIQVMYFKKTKGKRIFKMTPLHHHFELSGYKEKEVVKLFYLWGIVFALLGMILGVYLDW